VDAEEERRPDPAPLLEAVEAEDGGQDADGAQAGERALHEGEAQHQHGIEQEEGQHQDAARGLLSQHGEFQAGQAQHQGEDDHQQVGEQEGGERESAQQPGDEGDGQGAAHGEVAQDGSAQQLAHQDLFRGEARGLEEVVGLVLALARDGLAAGRDGPQHQHHALGPDHPDVEDAEVFLLIVVLDAVAGEGDQGGDDQHDQGGGQGAHGAQLGAGVTHQLGIAPEFFHYITSLRESLR
jgi:hypothetical protein